MAREDGTIAPSPATQMEAFQKDLTCLRAISQQTDAATPRVRNDWDTVLKSAFLCLDSSIMRTLSTFL